MERVIWTTLAIQKRPLDRVVKLLFSPNKRVTLIYNGTEKKRQSTILTVQKKKRKNQTTFNFLENINVYAYVHMINIISLY